MNYLSDEWIEEANTALASASERFGSTTLTIAQCVRDARSYVISINGTAASLRACSAEELPQQTLRFSQSWTTACEVARSETDAHQAFLLGDISFSGDVQELVTSVDVLADVAAILAPVMAQTAFPEQFTP